MPGPRGWLCVCACGRLRVKRLQENPPCPPPQWLVTQASAKATPVATRRVRALMRRKRRVGGGGRARSWSTACEASLPEHGAKVAARVLRREQWIVSCLRRWTRLVLTGCGGGTSCYPRVNKCPAGPDSGYTLWLPANQHTAAELLSATEHLWRWLRRRALAPRGHADTHRAGSRRGTTEQEEKICRSFIRVARS